MPFNIKPDPLNLPKLPKLLQTHAQNQYDRLKNKIPEEIFAKFSARPDFLYVLAMSDFIANTLFSYPKECCELLDAQALDTPCFKEDLTETVNRIIVPALSDFEFKKRLRVLRRTRTFVIAWRDLCGMAELDEVMQALSNLAEQIVLRTIEVVRMSFRRVWGDALCADGSPMPLLTYGMGKLGGQELNFSSDIDLIFAYPEDGETQGGTRSISFREFFTRIVQRSANFLSDLTVDSFCYRIDLRLRPFGDAGPMVSTFDGMATYYETQGRTWERYALVKARLLGGYYVYREYGPELVDLLRPFVYRRYLDYGAVQSLRKLKHMIEAELRRKRRVNNFKLGEGGIREIEFIAQVFELMRGGRYEELRERSLRKTLIVLADLELLPSEVALKLDDAYVYLRRLENVIQEFSDMQTQTLPDNELGKMRVLLAMNKNSYEEFLQELSQIMSFVHEEFCHVVSDDGHDEENVVGIDLWGSNYSQDELSDDLKEYMKDPDDSQELSREIIALKKNLQRFPVGPVGRRTLVHLMPKIILEICKEENSSKLFKKVAGLVEQVATRTPYMQLLSDNNFVLQRFIKLIKENVFASELVTAHPILLDELLIPQVYKEPPSAEKNLLRLQERLLRVENDDLEEQMEELRLFKKIMIFRIAMSDKARTLPVMKVSDALTWLAEAIVKELLILAWNQTTAKYGVPPDCSADDPGMAVIAYGKLGGIELGYKSDLDMVFICENTQESTIGERSVPCARFYQKLVQRLLHLSVTRTAGGILYDLDMRLRPDGDSGLLISDIKAFEHYQKNRAWTWEHQALVRSRPIAGSKRVISEFNRIRNEVLRTPRDPIKLKNDVLEMRNKMRQHLDRGKDKLFDLKQSAGGMVDIEFIAQYLLLREAPLHSGMVLWSDNVRIFDECARLNILDETLCVKLKDAYLSLRDSYHQISLADLPRLVAYEHRPPVCYEIVKIWKEIFKS